MDNRHKRQLDIIPEVFYSNPITIIGLGAIGRQVALQLASAGVQNLTLIDGDEVSLTNLSNQGYKESNIGCKKVFTTGNDIISINSEANVLSVSEMLTKKTYQRMQATEQKFPTVFCCIDSISQRKTIFDLLKKEATIFIDGRMTAESMRIISVFHKLQEDRDKFYSSTLFEADEAQGGTCTARSTIYCANVAAGLMVSQYTKILRGFNPENDICFNLLGNVLEIL